MERIKGLIDINICYRDRPTELGLLLESLRHQTYQKFDIYVSDDVSGISIDKYHFLNCLFSKLREDGHRIYINRNEFAHGVSKNRQKLVDISMNEGHGEFICRLDDDVIVESDYLDKLLQVIDAGYDLASGVTPPIMNPVWKREIDYVKPIINEVILDETGKIIKNGDDCGHFYLTNEIIPTHHFRSCALYKKELHDKGVDYVNRLTKHGFREEQIFSFKAIIKGFKLGVHTGAVVWHLLTPSGGERFSNSNQLVSMNQKMFIETTTEMFKKYGNFIDEYNKKLKIKRPPIDPLELRKENNLI